MPRYTEANYSMFFFLESAGEKIIQCCAIETKNKIIKELGDDNYAILADEWSELSHKKKPLVVCLRYVDKLGRPCEHFLSGVHVDDTNSLTFK